MTPVHTTPQPPPLPVSPARAKRYLLYGCIAAGALLIGGGLYGYKLYRDHVRPFEIAAEFRYAARRIDYGRWSPDHTVILMHYPEKLREGKPLPMVEMQPQVWALVQYRQNLSGDAREEYARRCMAEARRLRASGEQEPVRRLCELAWNFTQNGFVRIEAEELYDAAKPTEAKWIKLERQVYVDLITPRGHQRREGGSEDTPLCDWNRYVHLVVYPAGQMNRMNEDSAEIRRQQAERRRKQ